MIRLIDRGVEAAAVLLFAASTLMICLNVFYRYVVLDWLRTGAKTVAWLEPVYAAMRDVLGTVSVTADEVPGLLLVWIAYLGAYLAMRREGHISFDLLVDRAPAPVGRWIRSAMLATIIVFLGVVFWESVRMIRISGRTEIETAEIAQGWFMLAVPIACALLTLAIVLRLRDLWRTDPR